MSLTRLTLTNVRSHASTRMTPGPGFVVITGENGAGKTNILEAISLLAPGRGLRGAALSEMARIDGPGGFGIAAIKGDTTLATGTVASAPDRRIVRINGANAAATALGEHITVLWLTPAMDRLFSDSAGERRRFLDRLVLALTPGHARATTRYEAAMRQRNRLLTADINPDPDWLSALESQMAEHGDAIAVARSDLVAQLNAHVAARADTVFARGLLGIDGGERMPDLASTLARTRQRDAAAGRTLTGPHRADLIVTHLAKAQPASRCSTGEQKALLLGLILAHAELVAARSGNNPVLLLDEVAAHLDQRRRAALFAMLGARGGQVWMTGTDASLFDGLGSDASWFHIADGIVRG